MSSGERFARVEAIELCYETFGSPDSPPLLLVMGLAAQMILWEDDLCRALADRGFFVIRFDNRDVGRSTVLRDAPVPTALQLLRRDRRAAAYSLDEMADDATGLLDVLELDSAHVVGASMGGMIGQLMAIRHPERVRSLVSIMSTTGARRVGRADPRLIVKLLRRTRRAPAGRDGYVRDFLAVFGAIASKRYPLGLERGRELARRSFDRGVHPDGAARQYAAIIAAPDRAPLLRRLRVPATVIHGSADRLVRPSGGRATAAAIPDARLVIVPDMGHDLPPALWPQLIDEIALNAGRPAVMLA
jgi:pimeloyl-ACP methyl ester carboxylesterase